MGRVTKFIRFTVLVTVCSLVCASISLAGTIKTSTKEGLGTYLVDENGMTLYMFTKDTPDKSACGTANDCLKKWPLFYIGNGGIVSGVDATQIGAMPRGDGKDQTTYKGSPLYYFSNDKIPGDTKGQGLNNSWYVVSP